MRPTAGQQFRMDRASNRFWRTGNVRDEFFTKEACSRCGGGLQTRTMSWFTEETICMDCKAKEQTIKEALRNKGITGALEGCGYIPGPDITGIPNPFK